MGYKVINRISPKFSIIITLIHSYGSFSNRAANYVLLIMHYAF